LSFTSERSVFKTENSGAWSPAFTSSPINVIGFPLNVTLAILQIILLIIYMSITCFPEETRFHHIFITLIIILNNISICEEIMQTDPVFSEYDHQVRYISKRVIDVPANKLPVQHLHEAESSAVFTDYTDARNHFSQCLTEEISHQYEIKKIEQP